MKDSAPFHQPATGQETVTTQDDLRTVQFAKDELGAGGTLPMKQHGGGPTRYRLEATLQSIPAPRW
jgi:hypothetical protein